jgi:hypothetical protein
MGDYFVNLSSSDGRVVLSLGGAFFWAARRLRLSSALRFLSISRKRFWIVFGFLAMRVPYDIELLLAERQLAFAPGRQARD